MPIDTGPTESYNPSMKNFSETLRKAILADGRSQNEIAEKAGVQRSQLSRFVRGQRELTTGTVDALLPVLGLQLEPTKRRRKPALAAAKPGR